MFKILSQRNNSGKFVGRGQTFIEYTMLLGIVVAVFVALTPLVRRGTQGMVKLVSDQIGNQQAADQKGGKQGYLVQSVANTKGDQYRRLYERVGTTNYIFGGTGTETVTATVTNMGFSEREN